MAALIVGLAVMAILMTAAMPVWKHMVQREKEEELVFRGEQYARAIGMYQRLTANAYPPNLDVLVKQKLLRKKYKDPITNDDFVPLANVPAAGTGPAGQPGAAQPGAGQQPAQAGRGIGAPVGAPGQIATVAGIIGVTSKSTDQSIRLYKGRSHYNEWAFVYTPPVQAAGAGATGVAAPGAPVQGGQGPQGNPVPGQGGGARGRSGPPRGNVPNPFGGGPGQGR